MKIVYDSVKNILMLDQDGRNIQIITMKDEKGDKNHGNNYTSGRRVMLCLGKYFLKEECNIGFLLFQKSQV